MKKINIILGFILCMTYFNSNAQEINILEQKFPKHEIGVSCGLFAAPLIIPMYHGLFPSLNLSYYYNFNKHHAIGATLSFFYGGVCFFEKSHQDWNFLFESVILSPQISYRISYCQKKTINLYSVVSLGWKTPIAIKDDWVFNAVAPFPAFHVTFIGMRIGNQKNAFTIEVGYGTQGTAILGYTHKFISNKK